ncbi:MAG: hypothetical protein ACO1OK_07295, partial [Devosia sp.]
MDKRIAQMFEGYGQSFSAMEMRRVAALYADHFIAAGPKGIISQSRTEFLDNADAAAEFYKSVGQQKAELRRITETWYSEHYVMATVHWAVYFKKLPEPVEFDVSYLVQLTHEHPKIILFISH